LGTGNIDHRIGQHDLSDGAVAEPFAMPVADIENADAIVIVGSNLRHEVPLLHQRVRKAWRRGAKVHVVGPVDFEFTFDIASKAIVPPSGMADALASAELADAVRGAGSVAVIVGAVAENGPHASAVRAAAAAFARATGAALCRIPQGANALGLARHARAVRAGAAAFARAPASELCRIPQGANALGLARHGVLPSGLDAAAMLAQPRGAYLVYGIEPGLDFADQAAAMRALGAAQVV